jgi:hypothetical protein
MSLQRFKEEIKGRGLARTNKFIVEIGLPELIQKDMFNLEIVQLFCETASIPGVNIATQANRTFGEQREIPYDRNFEPFTLNFYVDHAMTVKSFFDNWLNSVIDPNSRTINYYEQYITDIKITVIGNNEDKIYTITLYEAYPKTIQSITLDQNSREAMKLGVTFNYKYSGVERYDILGGDPQLQNIFNFDKYEGLNGFLPFNYSNAGSQWASGVPSEYLQNALSFNEQYADQTSVSRALRQIQTQGIETALGSIFS